MSSEKITQQDKQRIRKLDELPLYDEEKPKIPAQPAESKVRLGEFLLRGQMSSGLGDLRFLDDSPKGMRYHAMGVSRGDNTARGTHYVISGIKDHPAFDPGDKRTTLVVKYEGDPCPDEIFLHEHFNDIIIPRGPESLLPESHR